MSFEFSDSVRNPESLEEYMTDIAGGNVAVAKWRHTPDRTDFDDGTAFKIIREAILSEDDEDPRRLQNVASRLADLLPAGQQSSAQVLGSVWDLVISLAQQTPSGNIALLNLVVILDHLSSSPKTTLTVMVDGVERLSRLHGLDGCIRESMSSLFQPSDNMATLTYGINLSAFAALLWSYNLIDGRDHAVRQLRSAFEDRRSADAADRDGADARLMAAAQWAIHASQRLYHLSVTSEGRPDAKDSNGNEGGGEAKWKPGARFKGRAGFSFRRWEFWQQAFEEAHEFGHGGIEAKVEAGAAAGMMEKVMYAAFEV
ncbi:hypothetical protein CCHL11_02156 [Colletotrichum chlorophyti]|uniref:Uncharacterized protein n=1 Tax=Colletotrichum chlorophyti TaxID=708187 RepID=A0A1Q8S6W7_9PEZI|nr:hypothetical protein CCHL11_02156 [Colletotrichum chlorophyti]